jgi:hypothetical protein
MGTERRCPDVSTPGYISVKACDARWAFAAPPFKQSANVKRGWRTGLENETVPSQAVATYQQVAGNITPECTGPEEKTFSVLDLLEIQRRANAPLHEFEVEINRLVC